MTFLHNLLTLSDMPLDPLDSQASWQESLELMGVGWGSIFIVIVFIMITILALNRIMSQKK